MPGVGWRPPIDEMLTMEPRVPAAVMWRATAWVTVKVPRMLTRTMRS